MSREYLKTDAVIIGILLIIFFYVLLLNVPVKKYAVNLRSGKYHRLDCEYAKKINPRFIQYESSLGILNSKGYKPCSECRPDE